MRVVKPDAFCTAVEEATLRFDAYSVDEWVEFLGSLDPTFKFKDPGEAGLVASRGRGRDGDIVKVRENTKGRGNAAFPRVGRVEAVVTKDKGYMCTVKDVMTGKMLKASEELVDPYVYGYSTNTVVSHTERRGGYGKRW